MAKILAAMMILCALMPYAMAQLHRSSISNHTTA